MTLNEFRNHLSELDSIQFVLPSGNSIPSHFHITEVGLKTKEYIDCGGTVRSDRRISIQLWSSIDLHHRLKADKVLKIIDIADRKFHFTNDQIEIEYQGPNTTEKYHLNFDGSKFQLIATHTDCLATENCNVPLKKINHQIKQITSCCSTGSGSC